MGSFNRGDIICQAEPFAYALNDSKRGINCDYCFKGTDEPFIDKSNLLADAELRVKPKRCSQCQILYFCNQTCQRNAWLDFHKDECSRLKRCPLQTASLLIARLYIKIKLLGKERSNVTDEVLGVSRSFDDLEQHSFNIKRDLERSSQLNVSKSMLKNFCHDLFDENNLEDVNLIEEIFGKVTINSFEIVNWQFQSVGAGLYLGPSILDHSCDPNAYVSFSGKTCIVRAAKHIDNITAKEIYISYVDVALPKAIRQQKLSEQYYFSCDCQLCQTDAHEASKLKVLDVPKGDIDNALSLSKQFLEEKEKNNIPLDNKSMLVKCKEILNIQKNVLGEHHVYRRNILDCAFNICIDLELWSEALELGLPLIDLYKLYYGETHCDYGEILFKIAKLYLHKDDLDQGLKYLEKAKLVFEPLLSENHPLLLSLLQQLKRTEFEKMYYYTRSSKPIVPGCGIFLEQ